MKKTSNTSLVITPKIKEKAKSMVMASLFGTFILTATNFELARAIARHDGLRVNRHIRSVAKGLVGKHDIEMLDNFIRNIASSSNTEKALNELLDYRNRFLSSAEHRIAAMNEYIGGDLDDLEVQGVPRNELTKRVADFRKLYTTQQEAA
ncbi:hypothetical protein KKJ09_12430 [Xenorhabdus bovienii]|uniref:hypothetical protein n=1 Tax=Xenorhabdus bovienii TaxID=40576 RepID=UPI0023B2F8CC|nr:hypothetical protein [Xenorhabdus bovienii]MDE9494368.1 hypothetical protein [Xenorhabdus bovienii]MDE9502807.1 hypothetical protein [Xenorhabdus bovienii]MDE9526422.1 hypothetical protein [Xenorhabdus bovienii]MDE9568788.1 hypothetical protein [Xenorhabdus bovienii]